MGNNLNGKTFKRLPYTIKRINHRYRPRNFLESIELQVGLKNYDLKKDKPIEGSKPLHFPTRSNLKICFIGEPEFLDQSDLINVDLKTTEDIKKFNKNKKLIKKFVKSYSAFLIPGTKKREIDSHLNKKLKERGKPP